MSRLIVYEPASVRNEYAKLVSGESTPLVDPGLEHGRRRLAQAQAAGSAAGEDRDGYLSKLAKYVPVEMITIATAFFAAFTVKGWQVWLFAAIGAVLNVLYLFALATQQNRKRKQPRPRIYFYPLSAVAFMLWSLASIEAVASVAGLTIGQRAFILTFAAFLIPAVDGAFSIFDQPGPQAKPARPTS
jgi:hypothetical protein